MATDQDPQKNFYNEVDTVRHQSGWWAILLFFVFGLGVIGLIWYSIEAGWWEFVRNIHL